MAAREQMSLRVNPAAREWARGLALKMTAETGHPVHEADVLRHALSVGKAHEAEIVRKIRASA